MANWTTIRNKLCDGVDGPTRAAQLVGLLCESLLAAGWSLVGQGGGTGSGVFQFDVAGGLANQFPAFPTAPNAQAWFVMRNADGVEICLWNESYYYGSLVVSPADGFVAGSADEDTPPANPADAWDSGYSGIQIGHGNYQTYWTIAYTDDMRSFLAFSRSSGDSSDWAGIGLLALENVAAADVLPTYCPYIAFINGASATNVWETIYLGSGTSGNIVGRHPTGSWQRYAGAELRVSATEVMEDIPADPITGEQPRITLVAACATAGYRHVRGTIPGIWRVPGNLATGDKLDSDAYVVVGDYCVPWGSTDTLQS